MKRLQARFFAMPTGPEPVRDWLLGLDKADRATIGIDIKDVEFGWPIGMPLCRSLGDQLWEVRSNLAGGRIARVLFFVRGNEIILLHSFMKTTQRTPRHEINLARRRMKDLVQ